MRDPEPGTDAAAWQELCRRLSDLGTEILGEGYPDDPVDRTEGFRHLAQQLVCWLGWYVGHGDPSSPAFHRQNDLVLKWGGPNIDNVYRHARVDPAHRYRIRGRMHSCEEFLLALRAGFMHEERWGTLHETTASELGIGPGDDFEILLGPDDGAIPIPEGAVMVSIREYYVDWQEDEPATFTIECLDDAVPDRPRPGSLVAPLLSAAAGLEHSMRNWNRYMAEHRAAGTDNEFQPYIRVEKGLASARYSFCFFRLEPDEALVVETEVPRSRYWSLQLYGMGWFESLDVANRIVGINRAQAVPGSDGRLRVVLAHDDPGVPNWLDTEGRREGLLTLRVFWSDHLPVPSTRVVPAGDVRAVLPPDTPVVDLAGRAAERARRRRHAAWRFRT